MLSFMAAEHLKSLFQWAAFDTALPRNRYLQRNKDVIGVVRRRYSVVCGHIPAGLFHACNNVNFVTPVAL